MSRLSYHTNEVLVEYLTLKILSGSIWATGRRASASCSASAASASGRWSTSSSSPSDMLDRPMDLCTSEKNCEMLTVLSYSCYYAEPKICLNISYSTRNHCFVSQNWVQMLFSGLKLGEFFSSIYFYRLRKIACCVSHSSKINFIKQNKPFHQKKVQHINVA